MGSGRRDDGRCCFFGQLITAHSQYPIKQFSEFATLRCFYNRYGVHQELF